MNKSVFFMTALIITVFNLTADAAQDVMEKFSSPFKIEEEYFIGKAVAVNLISEYGLVTDKKINDYVSAVGNTLALASDQPSTFHGYTFGVLGTDKIAAYACPDGFILITMGLIGKLRNEDELASVLASEIAHIVFNDPVFSVSKETVVKYNNVIRSSMNSDSNFNEEIGKIFGIITEEILVSLENGYDAEKNIRADNQAVMMLMSSNYSTSEFAACLETLYKSEEYDKNHPDMQKRIENIKKQIPGVSVNGKVNNNRTKRFTEIFGIK